MKPAQHAVEQVDALKQATPDTRPKPFVQWTCQCGHRNERKGKLTCVFCGTPKPDGLDQCETDSAPHTPGHAFAPGGDDSAFGDRGTWCAVWITRDGEEDQCGRPREQHDVATGSHPSGGDVR